MFTLHYQCTVSQYRTDSVLLMCRSIVVVRCHHGPLGKCLHCVPYEVGDRPEQFLLIVFFTCCPFTVINLHRVATYLEKPGILREFSEPGKLVEFSGNSVQPQGKIITNKMTLVQSNICIKQLLTG